MARIRATVTISPCSILVAAILGCLALQLSCQVLEARELPNFAAQPSGLKQLLQVPLDSEPSTQTSTNEPESFDTRPTQAANQFGDIANKVRGAMSRALAPAANYASLLIRYQTWLKRYQAAQKANAIPMKRPIEVVQTEYAKIDERIMQHGCKLDKKPSDESNPKDSVYDVLLELVDTLDRQLDQVAQEHSNVLPADHELAKDSPVDEQQVRLAMERVKSNLIKSAKRIVSSELVKLAQIAAVEAIMAYIVSQGGIDDSQIGRLAPIVQGFGYGSASLAMAYLRNVEYRAAMGMMDRAFPSINLCREKLFGWTQRKPGQQVPADLSVLNTESTMSTTMTPSVADQSVTAQTDSTTNVD